MKIVSKIMVITAVVIMLFLTAPMVDSAFQGTPQVSQAPIPTRNIVEKVIIQPTNSPQPSTPKEPEINPEYVAMAKQYSELVGYVSIPSVDINAWVFQASDNQKYHDYDRDNKLIKHGEIYMDFRCNPESLGRNTIIYGHHMKNGSMFAPLMDYKNKKFCKKHPTFTFNTLYGNYEWEIFSVELVRVEKTKIDIIKTDFASDQEWEDYIIACKDRSKFKLGVNVTKDDIMLTLVTCTYEWENTRLLIHARLIK